jgi:hypothetical protein
MNEMDFQVFYTSLSSFYSVNVSRWDFHPIFANAVVGCQRSVSQFVF